MSTRHGTSSQVRVAVVAAVAFVTVLASVGVLPPSGSPAGAAAAQVPQIWIAKAGVALGPVPPGTTSAPEVITIKNTGGATATGLVVGSPSNSAFKATDTCGASLAIRTTCTVTVRFAPTSGPTTTTGFVNVSWDGGLKSITLSGRALGPTFPFQVSPRALDFGEIPAGATSPGQQVLVTNTTTATVPVSFTGGSAAAPFSATNTCAGANLAPGASCAFTYRFSPTAVRTSTATDTITLTGGGVTRAIGIDLAGTSLLPVQVTNDRLDFGEVGLTKAAPVQPLVITNISTVPVTLGVSATAPTAGFTVANPCNGKTLAPAASCSVNFGFTPTMAGALTSTSRVTVTVGGTTASTIRSVELSGRGFSGHAADRTEAFLVSHRGFEFGNVHVGDRTPPQVVTLTNVSGTTQMPDLAGGAAQKFGGSQNCAGVPIPAGGSCQFIYDFQPEEVGPVTDTTSFSITPGNGFVEQDIFLRFAGRGTEPFLVTPRGFDFGTVPVGVRSPDQTVLITNVTKSTITMSMAGGAAGDFGGSQDCQGHALPPGGSCHLSYQFTPPAAGPMTDSTSLGLFVGTYEQLVSFGFVGTGGATPAPLIATPTTIDFGDVTDGKFSPGQQIVVTNTGKTTVTGIAFGTIPDSRFIIVNGCTALAPGGSCTFSTAFKASTPAAGDITVPLAYNGGSLPVRLVAHPRATPAPANDSFTTFVDTTRTVTVPANGLLANDTGIGLVVAGANPPAHGTVTTNFDGTYTYTPNAGYHGPDSFTYQALDTVSGTKNATVNITVAFSPNQAFAQAAYKDFLNRPPTDSELRTVAGGLDNRSLTRASVVGLLSSSTEYVSALVNSFYVDTLGRRGEASGVTFWVNEIRSGRRTVAQVAAFFYASDEYFNGIGGGTNRSWIADLYLKLLGRAADPSGLNFWVGQVQSSGRTSVAGRFYQSSESCHARVKALYLALLGRNPDQAGWDFWAAKIPSSGDLALAANLAVSDEYFSRARTRFP